MGQRRSRTVQVLGAIGAPVLLFGACSFQSVSTTRSAPSAPGPVGASLQGTSLEERLRASGALGSGERITQVLDLSADSHHVSLVGAKHEGARESRWVLAVHCSDGSLATTDQLPIYFFDALARVECLGRVEDDEVFGFVATFGGSGGWSEELHVFRRAGHRLEALGATTLMLSSSWRADGFEELCGADKPHTSRTVEVVREGGQLIVTGEQEDPERTSPVGAEWAEYRHVSSPIEEVYALLPTGVERIR